MHSINGTYSAVDPSHVSENSTGRLDRKMFARCEYRMKMNAETSYVLVLLIRFEVLKAKNSMKMGYPQLVYGIIKYC